MVTTNMSVLGSGVVGCEWLQGEARRAGALLVFGLWPDFIARHWGSTWRCHLPDSKVCTPQGLLAPDLPPGRSSPCPGSPGEFLFSFPDGHAAPWVSSRSGVSGDGQQEAGWQLWPVGTGPWGSSDMGAGWWAGEALLVPGAHRGVFHVSSEMNGAG